MQALLAPLKELAEYDEVRKIVRQGKGTVALSGCVDSQKLHMIYGLSDGLKYKVIVTYNDLKAKEIYEEYRFYDRNVMLYPAKDLIFFQADIHGNQLVQERIKTLRRVVEGKPVTIVTTYAALMTPQVLWEEKDIIHTERGGSLDESKLASRLVAMGYEKAYQVESPGQFSVRGGIVDIFDLTEENPYRIELWGDEVESIRSFDILSQRSIEKLESITVYPATEFVLSGEQIRKGIARLEKEAAKQEKIFRDAHQPEEAHRIATQVSELKEQLLEFQSKANLEGYIRYFYENTVTMPELLAADVQQERILKEYIAGPTVAELLKAGQPDPSWVAQVQAMCARLYPAGLNIDYYPTNFVPRDGTLYYIDYECSAYMEPWDFEHWGLPVWTAQAAERTENA